MENFDFKSQVATTKEQSERLLALGLKKETSDMVIFFNTPITISWAKAGPYTKDNSIPAWSLARLFEISNSAIHIGLPAMIDRQQPYDYLITTIEDYIKRDCFNKDYLEERK